MPSILRAVLLLSLVPAALFSQRRETHARVVSAPSEPSLLNLTSSWARASTLGDLLEQRAGGDYLELRVWHGFGEPETQATILRRVQGHWSASIARVIRCELQIPVTVGDTASATTMRRFIAEARRNCGISVVNVAPGARLLTTDTLFVQPIDVTERDIEAAWKDAERAGVLQLPGRVKRSSPRMDGLTFVI